MGLGDQQSSKGRSSFFTVTCSLLGHRKQVPQATLCPCSAGTGGRLACLESQGFPVSLSRWHLHIGGRHLTNAISPILGICLDENRSDSPRCFPPISPSSLAWLLNPLSQPSRPRILVRLQTPPRPHISICHPTFPLLAGSLHHFPI